MAWCLVTLRYNVTFNLTFPILQQWLASWNWIALSLLPHTSLWWQ